MHKSTRILIGVLISLIIIALFGTGWFWYNQKNTDSTLTKWTLPTISEMSGTNNAGKLFGPQEAIYAKNLSAEKIIELTNQYRADTNLKPLTLNQTLTEAAQTKVDDMFTKQYFEHISPSGTTPAQLVLDSGYNYKTTGENLALGDFANEADLVKAWYDSPGHRANMLNTDFTEIGVASGLNDFEGRHTWLSVQEFGTLAPNCAKPNEAYLENIDTNKTLYETLSSQMNTLAKEAQDLANQANQKMAQGNEVYSTTHSKTKAQPYWDESQTLMTQSQAKFTEAKVIDAQLKTIFEKINTTMIQYNTQVDSFNLCIK